ALQWMDLSSPSLEIDNASVRLPQNWQQWSMDLMELQLERRETQATLDADTIASLRDIFARLEDKAGSTAMARHLRKLTIPKQVVVYYRGDTVRSEQTLKKQADNEYAG